MRQIALFTTDWNYELVGETLRGVSAYLRLHPEVNVRVFDCFSIDEEDLEDLSLYEIYQLADLDQYDGAIVQTHQIVVKDVARRLERRLKAKGIPSVTVGVPLGEMPQVRSNDHESFYRITEHLIRTHGSAASAFRMPAGISAFRRKTSASWRETGKPMRERRPAGRSPRRRSARRRWSASMTIWPWERSAR